VPYKSSLKYEGFGYSKSSPSEIAPLHSHTGGATRHLRYPYMCSMCVCEGGGVAGLFSACVVDGVW